MEKAPECDRISSSDSKMKSQSFKPSFVPIANEESKSPNIRKKANQVFQDNCMPSTRCGQSCANRLFPFLTWFRLYEIGWLPNDILCGITVSIIYISQGMAYALLASMPPIIGLYMSFFPPLVYAFFGTSRHLSIGGIAVISLMTANAVNSFDIKSSSTVMQTNSTASNIVLDFDERSIGMALSLVVGILQLILSICRLGFVTAFLSDTFISGYTAGTAVLVLTSQMPDLFGIKIQRRTGAFKVIYVYTELLQRLRETNLVTFFIAITSMIAIYAIKEYIEPVYKRFVKRFKIFQKIQVPIPIELIVIIVGTVVSYKFDLNAQYNVKTIQKIGRGFPIPSLPKLKILPLVIKEAIPIAIVSYTICFSLAKHFAKQHNYVVDANQELSAYGLCNIISSFFGCYPCASSLARTSVFANVGGRTQLASLVSCVFLLITILQIGSLLEPMPKACLVAIIVVSLRGLLMKIKDVYTIGRVTILETIVWLATFLSTIILDVDYGLIIGILASFVVAVLYHFKPRTSVIGLLHDDQLEAMSRRFSKVYELPNIKILRFESSIMYFNGEDFHDSIFKALRSLPDSNEQNTSLPKNECKKYIIIDCAAISQIDYSGASDVNILHTVAGELKHDCLCLDYEWETLKGLGLSKSEAVTIAATISDALQQIQEGQLESPDECLLGVGQNVDISKP